jgi:hypothetical protein
MKYMKRKNNIKDIYFYFLEKKMNEEDKKRFARYYPDYVEPPEQDNEADNSTNLDKKNILGYIDKIVIDKDKLINDTINHSNKS